MAGAGTTSAEVNAAASNNNPKLESKSSFTSEGKSPKKGSRNTKNTWRQNMQAWQKITKHIFKKD